MKYYLRKVAHTVYVTNFFTKNNGKEIELTDEEQKIIRDGWVALDKGQTILEKKYDLA